jgi:hypothetical protein
MRNRILLLAAGCGLALLAIYHWPNRPDGGPVATPPRPGPAPASPAPGGATRDVPEAQRPSWETGWSKPAPEEAVLDVPEAVVLERLRQRGESIQREETLTTKGVPALLRGLGRPTAGHDAIHELICWLEFDETWFDPATGKLDTRVRYGSANLLPRPMEDNPAVVALLRVGEPAAPQLVNEYLHFFENTSREAWHNRWHARVAVDKNLDPLPKQSPDHRLYLIWAILTHRPEVSRRAVEHALARVKDSPEDDHLRRASQDLIRGIVDHYEVTAGYSPDKLAKLFPPDALRKE